MKYTKKVAGILGAALLSFNAAAGYAPGNAGGVDAAGSNGSGFDNSTSDSLNLSVNAVDLSTINNQITTINNALNTQAANIRSNQSTIGTVSGRVTTAQNTANSAYSRANTAQSRADTSYNRASSALSSANSAYGRASTAISIGSAARNTANSAYNLAASAAQKFVKSKTYGLFLASRDQGGSYGVIPQVVGTSCTTRSYKVRLSYVHLGGGIYDVHWNGDSGAKQASSSANVTCNQYVVY